MYNYNAGYPNPNKKFTLKDLVYLIIISLLGGTQIDLSSLVKRTQTETPVVENQRDPYYGNWSKPAPPTFWETIDLQPVAEPTPTPTPAPRVTARFAMAKPNNDEPELETTWLSSPVTRSWEYDEKRGIWKTDKYEKSLQSTPSIIIGLREDGVVVWKKVER